MVEMVLLQIAGYITQEATLQKLIFTAEKHVQYVYFLIYRSCIKLLGRQNNNYACSNLHC